MSMAVDIELVTETWVVASVGRLNHGKIVAGLSKAMSEKRVPDKGVLFMFKLSAPRVEKDQRGVEPTAVAGGAQVEDQRLASLGVKPEEIEIVVHRQTPVDS